MRIHLQLISFFLPLCFALAAIIDSKDDDDRVQRLLDSDNDPPQREVVVQGDDDVVSGWCPGCRRRQGGSGVDLEEGLIQLRIEMIKVEILTKLGLEAPPNVNVNGWQGQIPEPLQSNPSGSGGSHRRDQDDDYYDNDNDNDDDDNDEYDPEMQGDDPSYVDDEEIESKKKQIIIFSDSIKNCQSTTTTVNGDCFHFRPSDNIVIDDITSVQLWLYKTRHLVNATSSCPSTNGTSTLSVYALADDSPPMRGKLLAVHVVGRSAGWMTLDVEGIVRSWITDPKTNRGINVDYETDCYDLPTSHQRYRPFLVIDSIKDRMNQRRRSKRNAVGGCGEGGCCQKRSLYIDFHAVNWTFIISPSGFTADYCHGSCSPRVLDNLVSAVRRRTGLMQMYSLLRNNDEFLPCCSPTSFSDLSILYMSDLKEYIREDLPNIRVLSCGCS